MLSILNSHSSEMRILILGFGREGRSSLRYLRSIRPSMPLWVGDENASLDLEPSFKADPHIHWHLGEQCYMDLAHFDLILKSPGIPLRKVSGIPREKITSQTALFIEKYRSQVIGISGTKGKSTTSTLLYHLLKENKKTVLLAGNIGIPVFDLIPQITPETLIIMELSAHQGEVLNVAPSRMILLNIFQEHLDHFGSFSRYKEAKLNFCHQQKRGDVLLYDAEDSHLQNCRGEIEGVTYLALSPTPQEGEIQYSTKAIGGSSFTLHNPLRTLKGTHNLVNIAAAVTLAHHLNLSEEQLESALSTYEPLAHRLEYVGNYQGVEFYNDSIATIPEAAIAAMEALAPIRWIILGGFDRGIPYNKLISYLKQHPEITALLLGEAGKRIQDLAKASGISSPQIIPCETMASCIATVLLHKEKGGICLLSPAASSYDTYENFEQRGNHFKKIVRGLSSTPLREKADLL
ncbi:MAG: UDP-N-acetylmuramoyl-L-alanine--D-glutamate ligase [Bacteroidetes bacterium]|nr:MAG: UDP-N-acetylmuramoyl-L-alanine--D-glutamate ligase [Bacteroidota bacterium]